jgi:hypothetical protein
MVAARKNELRFETLGKVITEERLLTRLDVHDYPPRELLE